ncbi:MAG: DUF5110 domain-containing protein [Bacteroidaceae bacterium]|nr:DUF5110 domain-containing protein [Bacteroidaceae bacterium]
MLLFFVSSAICADAASHKDYGRGITLTLDSSEDAAVKMVKLEVVSENIIRVVATPEAQFPQKQSLIIVPQTAKAAYTVSEEGGSVVVKTRKVQAVVDKQTGRITFKDASGKVLLDEAAQGKTFTRFAVPEREVGVGTITDKQRNAWSWRMLFNSPDDEAFYGLGQHQSEDINYKGVNEELYQYNTKVSVPFVVSNKNYGILWDSYSYCRWGNPEDYRQLCQSFKVYNRGGSRGGLTVTYKDATGKKVVREEDSVYYDNAFELERLPKDIALDGSRVVFEGFIESPTDCNYRWLAYYSGYVRMFIDNKEVVTERWRTAWNPNSYKFVYPLKKGIKTPVRIEWEPDGGAAYCSLRAASPQTDKQQNMMSIWSEMSRDMDYYFIAGKNADEVISGYRTLTGKASVYPKWAFGFWQSRERYKTSGEIEQTLAEFRKRHIPIDNIVQDWNYWPEDQWGSHQFEAARFPNPQAMLDSVHAMHGRFMISVWPKFYCNTDNYKALDAKGWMYGQAVKDNIKDWVGPGYVGSFYDAYSAGARKLFWKQMNDNLFTKYKQGIDAWWMDASEPNVRDCTPMWYRKALCGPTALGSSTEFFNAYSIVNADAIYNGQRAVNKNTRVFLLTRSGFAGEQRYSTATWSGDIGTRWEDMRAQMTAGINYCIAGLPVWGMDQGGFCVERRYEAAQREFDKTGVENEDLKEWRELQNRWNQFGCFIPLYRAHGQWPLREVWNIAPKGHPCYESIVKYHKLRYRMMPYIYSMAGWVHFKDYTMMRGLIMDFNGDKNVENIKDQWMFGPSIMACPVGYYGARSRTVYLPKQKGWYDLRNGRHYTGGQTVEVDAPYDSMPVFAPEGAILPIGPDMEWSDEKKPELITLHIFDGADGAFELYEDEGTNYNYEKGKYATIGITFDNASKTVTIADAKGSFAGQLQHRQFRIILIRKGMTNAEAANAAKTVEYSNKEVKVKM